MVYIAECKGDGCADRVVCTRCNRQLCSPVKPTDRSNSHHHEGYYSTPDGPVCIRCYKERCNLSRILVKL